PLWRRFLYIFPFSSVLLPALRALRYSLHRMYSYLPFTFSFFLPRRRKSLPAAALQYRSSPCPARSAEHAITYYITSFCGFQLKKGIIPPPVSHCRAYPPALPSRSSSLPPYWSEPPLRQAATWVEDGGYSGMPSDRYAARTPDIGSRRQAAS